MIRKPRMAWSGCVLAAALTVAACTADSSDGPGADSGPGTITFMNWFYEGPMKAAYDGYVESFRAQDERFLGAEVETHPFVQYNDVLNVRLASGDPPDVAWILNALAPVYVDSGRLLDLAPLIEETPGFDLADFDPAALAAWQRGDALYALPFTNATNIVYYHVDAFEAAGVPTPAELLADGDWTWESLRRVANELVDAEAARFGYVFGNDLASNTWRVLVDLYGAYGALPWSADGTECRFDSPEAVAATELVHSMIYQDRSHPEPGVAFDFAAGDVGMALLRQNYADRLAEVEFGWDVIRAPDGPQGFVPSIAQNGIAVFADSPHAELAARFVIHTLTKENAAAFSANTPSPRRSLQNAETLGPVNQVLTDQQLQAAVIPSITADQVQLEFAHRNYRPLEESAQRVFDGEVWQPDADVPAAMRSVCAAITPLLGG